MINEPSSTHVDVLAAHVRALLGGVGIPNLDRYPEAEPLHRVGGSVNDWINPLHRVLVEVHEVCDGVGMRLQL